MGNKQKPTCFVRFAASDYLGPGCLIDGRIYKVSGDMYGDFDMGDRGYEIDDVRLLPPCLPQKIICVGLNYAEHAAESTLSEIPAEPVLFFKPPSAMIGHDDNIIIPGWVDRVDYEGELAVVIGRELKNVSAKAAHDGIFGYTCVNDVTARNIQKTDKQWTRAKGFDTFCPVGPYIITDIEPDRLNIETRLNGKIVQQTNTDLMMNKPDAVISFISKVMTLFPGDIISTGTPRGVGPVTPGDVVEVEIEKIGILRNSVVGQ